MDEGAETPTVTLRVNMTIAVIDASVVVGDNGPNEGMKIGVLKYWGNQGQMCVVLNDSSLNSTHTKKGIE